MNAMQLPKIDTGNLIEELKENASEVLKTFSKVFLVSCGSNLLESIREEIEIKEERNERYTRRLTPYERGQKLDKNGSDGRFREELWMKVGGGAGDFDKWKKVYVVQEASFDITIYETKKHADEGKKPIAVIQPAGYILTTQVKQHYQDDIRSLIKDIREVDVDSLTTDLEEYTWALTHVIRPNYVFLARPSTVKAGSTASMICSCGKKVEPEKVVEETREEKIKRERAIEFMRTCIDCAQPRDKTTLEGKSFEMTIRQLPQEIKSLRDDWTDDGTESEILVDLLMEVCMTNGRNQILNDSKGGPPIIRIKSWSKIRKSVHTLLNKLVDEAWSGVRHVFKEIRVQIEPTIRAGLAPIAEFGLTVEEKINGLILNRLLELLGEFVSPFIKPLMELFETPLRASLENGRKLLEDKLNPDNLPADIKEWDDYLEDLLTDTESRTGLYQRLDNMQSALEQLRSLNTSSTKMLQGVRLARLRTQVETAVNEILDASIHSFKIRLNPAIPNSTKDSKNGTDRKGITNPALQTDQDNGGNNVPANSSPAKIFRQVLSDFDHDVMIVRSEFVKAAVHNLLLEAFHKIADPHIKPAVSKIDQAIPEPFQKFISLSAILDKIVDRVIRVPVEKAVEVAYPIPEN